MNKKDQTMEEFPITENSSPEQKSRRQSLGSAVDQIVNGITSELKVTRDSIVQQQKELENIRSISQISRSNSSSSRSSSRRELRRTSTSDCSTEIKTKSAETTKPAKRSTKSPELAPVKKELEKDETEFQREVEEYSASILASDLIKQHEENLANQQGQYCINKKVTAVVLQALQAIETNKLETAKMALRSSIDILRGQQKVIRKSSFKDSTLDRKDSGLIEKPNESSDLHPLKQTKVKRSKSKKVGRKKTKEPLADDLISILSSENERYQSEIIAKDFPPQVYEIRKKSSSKSKVEWSELDVVKASEAICTAKSTSSSYRPNVIDLAEIITKLYVSNAKLQLENM